MDNGRWIRVESTDTAFLALRFAKSFETHKLRHNLLLVERLLRKLNSFNSKKMHATCIPFLLKSALDKRTGTLYAKCLSIYVTDDTNTLKPINCKRHRKNHRSFSKRMMDSRP